MPLVSRIQKKINTNLDPLFVVDPADHLDAHLCDLVEVRLLQANIPQDLNDPLPHTNTCVLWRDRMGTKTAQHRQEEWLQFFI